MDFSLSNSAEKAVANEFDPTLYPETKGQHVELRKAMNELVSSLPGIVKGMVDEMSLTEKMEVVRAINEGQPPSFSFMGGMGAGEVNPYVAIGTTIADAVAKMYGSYTASSAARELAQIRADSAAQQYQLQLQIAQATQAIKNSTAPIQEYNAQKDAESSVASTTESTSGSTASSTQDGGVVATLTQDIGAGIPLWAVPAGLGVLGAIYLIVRRK